MPKRVNSQSLELLVDLAEHRILSLSQIALLRFGSKRSARRRTQDLLEGGLIEALPIRAGRETGRPESIYGLSSRGYQELVSHGRLPGDPTESLTTGQSLLSQGEHQLLLNWTRLNLVHVARQIPRITVKVLSCNSPFAWFPDEGRFLISDQVEMDGEGRMEAFSPDAAISVTDSDQGRTVLFLLEVDRGTEPVREGDPPRSNIESKIRRYQAYFQTKGYKRYEEIFGADLNGFRLLFLTDADSRHAGLCSLVRGFPPSDFIWLTTEERMRSNGISGSIWNRGGRIEQPLESILGTLAQDLPIPSFEG